ncbi:MAG: hypothetical protein ABSB80_04105 [Methanoregula sp.]|jgi:hypothetical protein|uniref:hypothetical protein n=1 Tax=Methanoregula sp. TaxID=2052170 RepID=UPI003D13B137
MESESKIQYLKKYLVKIIDDFRKEYDQLDDVERKYIAQNTLYSVPCQIEIFWVSEPSEFQLFVLLHDPNRQDKEIIINGPYNANQIVERVIEIMDEPRWRGKAPHSDDNWPFPSDVGDKEHKYSDEFAGHFSTFLDVIRQTVSQSFPPGLIFSQAMGEIDYCAIFKGNIANLPPAELDQKSFIESAKQYAESVKRGLIPDIVQSKTAEKYIKRRNFFGSYYSPGARIGDNVELPFREKIFGPNMEYPKYEYGFAFNGRMGFYDRYGLVIIEGESEAEAIKIINTIFGISILYGIEAFSVRKSDVLSTDPPFDFVPLGQSLGSYSRKISKITGQAPNFFAMIKKTQINFEKMQEIIKVSEIVFRNENLNESLLFLLESNTHLKNSEFSQAYIFCWLIVEQYISKKFRILLSEKKEIAGKQGKNKDPDKERNSHKLKLLYSNGNLGVQEYSFLTEYNKKRNDFVHSGKTITEPDAENLFLFAFKIVQDEISDLIATSKTTNPEVQ